MLGHLVKKPQKTEPKLISCFRYFVLVTSTLALLLFAILLLMKLGDEVPIITITSKLVPNLPAPVIYLSFTDNFTVNCTITDDDSSCNEYVTPTTIPEDYVDIDRPYVWAVRTKGNILLATGEDNSTNPVSIQLDITTNSSDPSSMIMNVFDSELDPWSNDYNASVNNLFISTLEFRNLYYLANGNFYEFEYSKRVRKMINDPVLSYIGFRPSYTSLNYIESQIQIAGENKIFSSVEISPNNFAVDEETEQRVNTVVSILGTIGGYYGIIGAFYIFLFGADSISPWGFAHKGCGMSKRLKKKTKDKLKKKTEEELEKNKDHTLITIDDTNDHSKRLRDLEAFRILIEKNFIDASLIKPIEKEQKKKQQDN